jgi:hypothetical protein
MRRTGGSASGTDSRPVARTRRDNWRNFGTCSRRRPPIPALRSATDAATSPMRHLMARHESRYPSDHGVDARRVNLWADEFAALHDTCERAGHVPAVYVYCRSMKPRSHAHSRAAMVIGQILDALPLGMDLLLPGSSEGMTAALAGYRLDLLVVYGFSWKPRSAGTLGLARQHPLSLLPRYRGPAPVLWDPKW